MRSVRIFLTGIGALLLVLVILNHFATSVLVFAGLVGLAIPIGFSIVVPRYVCFILPPLPEFPFEEVVPGVAPQAYQQLFVFRTELQTMWALAVSMVYSMALAVFVLERFDLRWSGSFEWESFPGPFIRVLAGAITGTAASISWMWVWERLVLNGAEVGLAGLHAAFGRGEFSYQYVDSRGDRRGDMATAFNPITSPLAPVFVHARWKQFSKPGFAFLFHRFVVIDSRHFSQEQLEKLALEANSK